MDLIMMHSCTFPQTVLNQRPVYERALIFAKSSANLPTLISGGGNNNFCLKGADLSDCAAASVQRVFRE